jgi:hypothetical protein
MRPENMTETSTTPLAVKASFRKYKDGKLEMADNAIRFSIERGRFKKKVEIVREILLTDIESANLSGNEFSISWKGFTDVFVVEKAELAGMMNERINEALKQPSEEHKDEEVAVQQKDELPETFTGALEIVDPLFDVLRNLHGRVNWATVEDYLKRSEEYSRNLNQTGKIVLDFTNLSSAVKARSFEATKEEIYLVLKSLFEFFNELTLANEAPEQAPPSLSDAKKTLLRNYAKKAILAYFTLNDIILGITVADKEIDKETNELLTTLDDLSKQTGSTVMNVDVIKGAVDNLVAEKAKASTVEECRKLLKQQLKELLAKID